MGHGKGIIETLGVDLLALCEVPLHPHSSEVSCSTTTSTVQSG